MLRDGAMAAGCLFDPALVSETFLRGVAGLLRVNSERGPAGPRAQAASGDTPDRRVLGHLSAGTPPRD
ncbi:MULTISPECIES: hypothetical protein [unclassified Micromonospora]|uniref:hypothetical protein n=1 Tax=unclassified Micromonospora TaxID=2617518 RepID=UPI0020B1EE04|nr:MULTISPECIES: hypothetical protein [unclassified Micromonospora]MDM4781009.1 hypothetical protein [Micromonospora sp. b486]